MRWSVGDPNEFFKQVDTAGSVSSSRAPSSSISIALFITYFGVAHQSAPYEIFLASLSAQLYNTHSSWSWCSSRRLLGHGSHRDRRSTSSGTGLPASTSAAPRYEMGAMLIYLQPAFYCNVNDAWTFPNLKSRLLGHGSRVAWHQRSWPESPRSSGGPAVPDTLVSQVALIAPLLIGGAMTLLANANPLDSAGWLLRPERLARDPESPSTRAGVRRDGGCVAMCCASTCRSRR